MTEYRKHAADRLIGELLAELPALLIVRAPGDRKDDDRVETCGNDRPA